ncbi:helix-turn-helix transcriptional regulator [Nodularia spumigena]|uniref:Helix-turn-helix domain-containing protein n=1 Tax=Nodularia spumigena UHCC 0060 TaxID=3110300 RepID=A0ABU5UX50_NODSP|nr:helix-turn-helix domain-containing protein [Nodularia spumigena]MEA5524632.1 helix-turn-helix domain-containing protein [Nodularia spumigena UHCC 0143]MEA5610811.1 helix-turn-helix domain-containing protein [Nodularia spumigena UHCC 0060]MEA5615813.1 helix-turn-helix domain-containing protein [Nodularia spumigena UHCC 0040]
MSETNEKFLEASNNWDLETLYTDLASVKGKRLTPVEKLHLRGLLLGYSPAEIADKLGKEVRGVETDFSATIYRYVKGLLGKCHEKINNWRSVIEWLDEAGYKTEATSNNQETVNFESVDIIGRIASIKFCKKRITIEIDTTEVDLLRKDKSSNEPLNEPL